MAINRPLVLRAILYCLLALFVYSSVWTQINVRYFYPQDVDIYVQAGAKVLTDGNPYHPFEIGASFVYPPVALLIFAPLSMLENPYVIWATINICCHLLFFFVLIFVTRCNWNHESIIYLTILILFFAPFLEQITVGQINDVVLLCLTLFLLGLTHEQYRWLGDFSFALAILLKISPVILITIPFFMVDWLRLKRIAISFAFLVGLSVVVLGSDIWVSFLTILPNLFQGYLGLSNQSPITILAWLAPQNSQDFIFSSFRYIYLLSLIAIWLFVQKNLQNEPGRIGQVFCIGVITMTIASSLIWFHHMVFLLLPFVYVVTSTNFQDISSARITLIPFGVSLLIINMDRLIEYFVAIPIASVLGYWILYIAVLLLILNRNHSIGENQVEN